MYSALDVNQQCELTKYDFEAVIVPLDKQYSSLAYKKQIQNMTETTISIIREVFEQLFLCRKSLDKVKNTLERENIDLNDIFNDLDFSKKGYLTQEDIQSFVKTSGCGTKLNKFALNLFM